MTTVVGFAVPPRVTSPGTKSTTGSLNTAVKLIGDWLVGLAWLAASLMVTEGGVMS